MNEQRNKLLAITGSTGKKSGGAFMNLIYENLSVVQDSFPGGIKTLVRESSDTSFLSQKLPDVELFQGDITNTETLELFLENVDTLVHIAGIGFSEKIVTAAVKCKVRRLILVHTTGIYSKYKEAGRVYREIEEKVYHLCKKNGIILSICRPTMIYGNTSDQNVVVFLKMVDILPIMPVVNGARYELQPVHYEDLAKAYFNILMNEEKTANKDYILSGGAPIELREMLKIMGTSLGKNLRFINCPFAIAYWGSWVLYCLTLKKIDYREKVQRLCEPRVYSHEEATKDFGYSPMCFKDGVRGEIEQYLKEKNKKV